MSICPHCKQPFTTLRITKIRGTAQNGQQWNCISCNRPNCSVSLSVAIDPIAIRSDIITAVMNTPS